MPFFHLDLISIVKAVGYAGIALAIFSESGVLFGIFFPGDSLLFTSGLIASQGFLNIFILIPLIVVSAILGDTVGYWFGAKVGTRLFTREDSFFFKKRHAEKTRDFYGKYGTKAVFLSRFIPIIRTIAPILAGVAKMNYAKFLKYNVAGGILWGAGITLIGYFLGSAFPGTQKYLTLIIAVIIVVSFAPIIFEIVKRKNK